MIKSRDWITHILKFAFSFGIIAWLIHKGLLPVDKLLEVLNPTWFLLLAGIVGINVGIAGCRWWLLLRARKFDISLKDTVTTHFIGLFFNFALPGSVGGDLVKGYYIVKGQTHRKLEAAMTVIMDRVIGLYAMLFLAMSSVVFNWSYVQSVPQIKILAYTFLLVFVVYTSCLGLALSRRVNKAAGNDRIFEIIPMGKKLHEVYMAIHSYRDSVPVLLNVFLISIVAHSLIILIFGLVASAIGEAHLGWSVFIFAVPLGLIATALPLAPAGIGVGQVALLFLVNTYAQGEYQVGQIAVTVFQALSLGWGLIGAYFYLRRKQPTTPVASEVSQ